jgi:O-antigen/teichoic acid export membrane protein
VRLIAGDSYQASAGRATQLLFAAIAVGYINAVLSQALIASHQQRYLVVASPLALAFNIALNLALVPSRGAEGAGIALVCTELVSAFAAGLWLRRVAPYPTPLRFAVRLLPAVALTIAALWLARDEHLIVRIALLGIAYAVGVLVAGAVRVDELKAMLGRNREIRTTTPLEEADL